MDMLGASRRHVMNTRGQAEGDDKTVGNGDMTFMPGWRAVSVGIRMAFRNCALGTAFRAFVYTFDGARERLTRLLLNTTTRPFVSLHPMSVAAGGLPMMLGKSPLPSPFGRAAVARRAQRPVGHVADGAAGRLELQLAELPGNVVAGGSQGEVLGGEALGAVRRPADKGGVVDLRARVSAAACPLGAGPERRTEGARWTTRGGGCESCTAARRPS